MALKEAKDAAEPMAPSCMGVEHVSCECAASRHTQQNLKLQPRMGHDIVGHPSSRCTETPHLGQGLLRGEEKREMGIFFVREL